MNWLAHTFLSTDDIDYQLGNLLADLLRDVAWPEANAAWQAGFAMHRRIDSFTDSHAQVSRSKQRLREKGYLKGVVIDVLYDHFLWRNWADYCTQPAAEFIDCFEQRAVLAVQQAPPEAQAFIQRLLKHRILHSYAEREGIYTALRQLDKRLSERLQARELASDYIPDIEREWPQLEQDFQVFFPELLAYVRAQQTDAPAP